MTLSDVSIRRPILTWMMTLALIVFGVLGFLRLGVDQFPNLEFPVLTVQAVAHIVDVIPLLSNRGLHHVPIVDDQQRLVGMVTQSDVIAALYSKECPPGRLALSETGLPSDL